MSKRALIAMSGGVDSSVAALLMLRQGYECIGVTMKLYDNELVGIPSEHGCCTLSDVEDARGVAFRLGMRHYVCNFEREFRHEVIDHFISAYLHGSTPNPCIDCNRELKFGCLARRAMELDCDCLVTGHYARIGFDDASGRWLLRRASDENKDQSYVLYMLTQQQLAHTAFPLGSLTKAEVRDIAEKHGLRNAGKHDSQDICFVPDGRYADFIEHSMGKPCPHGKFIDAQGHVLGEHRGIIRYTVGQHRRLGIALGKPMYVLDVNPENNTVTLGDEAQLFQRRLKARYINLIAVPRIDGSLRCRAKLRYRQSAQWANVTQTAENELIIEFDEPQRAITRGQAVVLYDGDIVIGGGTIQ